MTVCIAALFRWNYGTLENPEMGMAAITVSDRMITIGNVEYEPMQLKSGLLTPTVMGLIAGDYDVHSECFHKTHKHFRGSADARPFDVAMVYAQSIKAIHSRVVENQYLAPFGMNSDTFLGQQRELHDGFVDTLTRQMQSHRPADVAALIVGIDEGQACIYQVDARGNVSCFNDAGFAAIGLGGEHACLSLAQSRYTNAVHYGAALAMTYAAKKAAETAPGVGPSTDMYLIGRDGVVPVHATVFERLELIYSEFSAERLKLNLKSILLLDEFIAGERERINAEIAAENQGQGVVSGAEKNGEGNSGNP